MRIVASHQAAELIREQGGRLYVWIKLRRCCGSVPTLATAPQPPDGKEFREIDADGFALYMPVGLQRLPDELHLDLHRFPRRVEAYWNGCAWVA